MKINLLAILTAIVAMVMPTVATAQETETPIAFPGCEGYGRYTTGGRGGKVYHVTTLEDTNTEGSFRWACTRSGTRTIVFDVSGTIYLKSELKLNSGNVTIAGQTAPGDGICIADYPFVISAPNVIIRFMRFRLGNRNVANHEGDGLGGMDSKNIVIDHCSVSWSIDECLSVYGSHDITVQWCFISHSLVNSGHSKGAHGYGGNWGGSGASYHHNFMTNHGSRTPRLGPRPGTQTDERMDLRNNVIHNYGGNAIYGGEGMNVNIVNNYFQPGKASPTGTKGKRIAKIDARTFDYCLDKAGTARNINNATGLSLKEGNISTGVNSSGVCFVRISATGISAQCPVDIEAKTLEYEGQKIAIASNSWWPMIHKYGTFFVEGNVNSLYPDVAENNWENGIYNQMAAKECDQIYPGENNSVKDGLKRQYPVPFVYTTTHDAKTAYERVLEYAGCSLSRDKYDQMLVREAREGICLFGTNGLIDNQTECKYDDGSDSWPALKSFKADEDSDGDGIPDWWESSMGLNPNDAEDGNAVNSEGYTNLEVYLNSLVAEIMENENAGGIMMNDVDGAPSGIDFTLPDIYRPMDNRIFNLMGVEVKGDLVPGIYIQNGKKFIIR